MRIKKVKVCSYRCLQDVEINFENYTTFIGENGTGKSSFMYALAWFFGKSDTPEFRDLCEHVGAACTATHEMKVSVTFNNITEDERVDLTPYIPREGDFVLTRMLRLQGDGEGGAEDASTNYTGQRWEGPGFRMARDNANGKIKINEQRKAYADLVEEVVGLQDKFAKPNATREEMLAALLQWEENNPDELVGRSDDVATEFFGIGGHAKLQKFMNVVLVPASADLTLELADGKGSILSSVLADLYATTAQTVVSEWEQDNKESLGNLQAMLEQGALDANEKFSEPANELFGKLIPNAELVIRAEADIKPQSVQVRPVLGIIENGKNGNESMGIDTHGHGVQRAALLALINASAESGKPTLWLVEEPELYQHPARARHISAQFAHLTNDSRTGIKSNLQMVIATHSPYFINVPHYESVKAFQLERGLTVVRETPAGDSEDLVDSGKYETHLHRVLQTDFVEGLFARCVLLVEGPTDKVVYEHVIQNTEEFESLRGSLVVVSAGGIQSIESIHNLFTALGILTYVIADGDAQGSRCADAEKRKKGTKSMRDNVNRLLAYLSKCECACKRPVHTHEWGGPSKICKEWAVYTNDLESELASWDCFTTAQQAQRGMDGKKPWAYYLAMEGCGAYTLQDLPEDMSKALTAAINHFSLNQLTDVFHMLAQDLPDPHAYISAT